jgi:hypothetical protein
LWFLPQNLITRFPLPALRAVEGMGKPLEDLVHLLGGEGRWVDRRYEKVHTPSMKTAVSIPDKIFRSADSLAKRLGVSRSRLYATALADFLSRRQSQQVKERLDAIYGEEESALDPGAIKLQAKSLPPGEW